MLLWLQANLPTVLIIIGLILFFSLLIWSLVKEKKKGKSSCCGGCAGCAMACPNRAGQCHGHQKTAEVETPADGIDAAENKKE